MSTNIVPAVLELVNLLPDIYGLYSDLISNGQLDSAANLNRIIAYVDQKSATFSKYASHGEVLMLVCGLLGVLHQGDSSGLYLKLLESSSS